jgi:hypothetical protein
MDAYNRRANLGKKNLADSVAIYGRGRELFIPPTYIVKIPSSEPSLQKSVKRKEVFENG